MSKQSQKSSSQTPQAEVEGQDIFSQTLAQTRKLDELDKELEYWKEKCLDLQINLNMQQVEENQSKKAAQAQQTTNQESEEKVKKIEKYSHELSQQVRHLEKDLSKVSNQNKSLQMQIAQKDQQIETFQKQTQQQFDELDTLQEKFGVSKEQNEVLEAEKKQLEAQLQDAKTAGEGQSNRSTNNSTSQLSPDQYLEMLESEKNLQEMLHFCQLVNAKYMQMVSNQYLDQLKSGPSQGGVNQQQQMPGMSPQMPMMGAPGMPGLSFPNLQQPNFISHPFQQMGMHPQQSPTALQGGIQMPPGLMNPQQVQSAQPPFYQ